MNKLTLFIALAAVLFLSNCSRDKDAEPVTPQTQENSIKKLLLGKWKIQFTATDWNRNGIPDQDEKEFAQEAGFVTFNIDGTMTVTDEQGTQSNETFTRWTLDDKELTLTSPDNNFEEEEPYTIVVLNTMEMLWKTPEDSANFFYIGFTRE